MPQKLSSVDVAAWVSAHPGWTHAEGALHRGYSLTDYGALLSIAMRVGALAEKRDHHPDLKLVWGRIEISWSTHDAAGVTSLDLEMAELTERMLVR